MKSTVKVARKFFYDHFLPSEIGGLFTPWHFFYIFLTFAGVALALCLTKNMKRESFRKTRFWIAVSTTVAEVIKIALRVYKGEPNDTWIPFYFCGLFLFAVWFSMSKNTTLSILGNSFLTMGGIMAGIIFTLYPSTSLLLYPAWHPSSIHALIYHGVMMYLGTLTLIKHEYTPRKSHWQHYFIFITAACVMSISINPILGTNCMFMDNPFGMPLLTQINEWWRPAYMFLAWIGQSTVLYWFNLGMYKISDKRTYKRKNARSASQKEEEDLVASKK